MEDCGYIQSITNIHNYGYTYDKRGNLVKEEEICSPTTQGPKNITIAEYTYDETNKMVMGTNKDGEVSIYTYNGLGVRVGTELILQDNTHGYTDFHCQTPSVETGIDKPEVVLTDYVIDYTRLDVDQRVLLKSEEGGYDYRYVYGLDKLSVRVTGEGTNWWGQSVSSCIYKQYLHTDHLGSVVNQTDQYGRVPARVAYSAWGELGKYQDQTVSGGFRILLPEITYAGHEYDAVLNLYYAKARMYDAEHKRFTSVDPILDASRYDISEYVTNPAQLVQYIYVLNNPLIFVDPLGTETTKYQFGVGGGYGYDTIELITRTVQGEKYTSLNDLLNLYSAKMNEKTFSTSFMIPSLTWEPIEVIGNEYRFGSIPHGIYSTENINITINETKNTLSLSTKNYGKTSITLTRINGEYFVKVSCFSDAMSEMNYAKTLKEISTTPQLVKKDQLVQFGWIDVSDAEVQELNRILEKYEINTPLRIAFFLGEVKHESSGFSRTLEKFIGSNPEDYFNNEYSNRSDLGNQGGNDGELYRGAGYLQITGRGNYQRFANYINDQSVMTEGYRIIGGTYNRDIGTISPTDRGFIDIGKYAWEVSGWFWTNSVNGNLNAMADAKDHLGAKNGINPLETDEILIESRRKKIEEFYKIYTGTDLLW